MALESTFQTGIFKQFCEEGYDYITNLPPNATERILEFLPFHLAVRMSILSKDWRHKWVTLTKIVLDQIFFNEVLMKKFEEGNFEIEQAYINIINNILLRHIGPIETFSLYIPTWFSIEVDIDQWLQYITPNCIKNLILFSNSMFLKRKLPSLVYSFVMLKRLELYYFHDLNMPETFEGFPFLISLSLHMPTVGLDASKEMMLENLISLCSRLQQLTLFIFGLIYNLTICSPELQELVLKGIISSLTLKNTKKIKRMEVDVLLLPDNGSKKSMIEFFSSLLNCQTLILGNSFWGPVNCGLSFDLKPLEKLGKELESLKTIELVDVPLDCNYAVAFIICLFRSSVRLQDLSITVASIDKSPGEFVEKNESFTLNSLKNVKVVFKKSVELEWIKIILACSPTLDVMTIVVNDENFSNEQNIEVAKELMQCGRASPNVEIILKP